MFWMPAPGTTLMLKLASWLRTSSTNPPACAYHPPPIWPAVQVRFFCCAHAAVPPSPRASARTIAESRLMIVLRRSSGSCPSARVPAPSCAEAAGIEEGDVEGGRAVDEPLGDIPAGGGRVLEAVAAEADGEEEALDARRPAKDGVVAGREPEESGPAAGDPRGDRALGRPQARHASVRHRERRHRHPRRDRHAELARAAREAGRHLGGAGHAVLGPPDRRDQVVDAEGGDELLRVGGGDDAH